MSGPRAVARALATVLVLAAAATPPAAAQSEDALRGARQWCSAERSAWMAELGAREGLRQWTREFRGLERCTRRRAVRVRFLVRIAREECAAGATRCYRQRLRKLLRTQIALEAVYNVRRCGTALRDDAREFERRFRPRPPRRTAFGACVSVVAQPEDVGPARGWCATEQRAWQAQLGVEVGRQQWLREYGTVARCGNQRAFRVAFLRRAAEDGCPSPVQEDCVEGRMRDLLGQQVALESGFIVEQCGNALREDAEAFGDRYEKRPQETAFGACIAAKATELQPEVRDIDRRYARTWCARDRRGWQSALGAETGDALWLREYAGPDRCTSIRAPRVARLRAVTCTELRGADRRRCERERLPDVVAAEIRTEQTYVDACADDMDEDPSGFARMHRAEAGGTALGTCVAELVGERGVISAPLDRRVSLRLAALLVLLAWLVIGYPLLRAAWRRRRAADLVLHLAVTLPVVASCAVALLTPGAGESAGLFDLDSKVKKVVLPLGFVALVPLIVLEARRRRAELRAGPADVLAAALLALAALGVVVGLAEGNDLDAIAQDFGLSVFFAAFYAAGRLTSKDLLEDGAGFLVRPLLLLGLATTATYAFVTLLYSFELPIAFAALLFVVAGRLRWWWGVVVLAVLALFVYNGTDPGPLPSSVYLQVAGAAGVAGYWALRRFSLIPAGTVLVVVPLAVVAALALTEAKSIVTADYDGTDLSFAQRAYEAKAVRERVDGSVPTAAVGAGFGATVDLSQSPDVRTLSSFRNDTEKVDDVHLLPYDFLLKRGLLGVLWLAAFAGLVLFLTHRAVELSLRRRDPTLVFLALVVVLSTINSVQAASHLLANPLGALCLGLLITRLANPPEAE